MASHYAAKFQNKNSIVEISSDHGLDSRAILLRDGSHAMNSPKELRIRSARFRFVWTFEIFCAALSCASLVAIIVLLNRYDGEPLSTWVLRIGPWQDPVSISLNFIVSILSTLAKSTSAVVLSSCLSQLKWNWFSSRQRPLDDFQVFDDASRGPIGSMELLWKTKARRLASIGAILTVLSLAFDPFAQLLITYPGDVYQVPSDSSTIAYAQRYVQGEQTLNMAAYGEEDGRTSITTPYSEIIAAIYNGIWSRGSRMDPNYECDNGNCTWPSYVSLSICSACFDISNLISQNTPDNYSCGYLGDVSTMVLPSPTVFSLEPYFPLSWVPGCAGAGGMQSWSSADPNETVNFRDSQTLLFSVTVLKAKGSKDESGSGTMMTATECGLQFCSNIYSSVVNNGNFSETIVTSTSERVRESWRSLSDEQPLPGRNDSWNPPYLDRYIPRADFQVELSSDQRSIANTSAFNISQAAVESTMKYLYEVIPPPINGSETPAVVERDSLTQYEFPVAQALYKSPSIEIIFENMAADMSAAIRNAGSLTADKSVMVSGGPQPEYSLPAITGVMQVYTITIVIRWAFIALPAVIIVLSSIFLLAAIIQTSRLAIPSWKDNALAGLVWGLDQETKDVAKISWVEIGAKEAGKMTVMFRGGKKVGELTSTND